MNAKFFAFIMAECVIPISKFGIAPDGDSVDGGGFRWLGIRSRVLLMKKESSTVFLLEFYVGKQLKKYVKQLLTYAH
jgi:hypothetical protein